MNKFEKISEQQYIKDVVEPNTDIDVIIQTDINKYHIEKYTIPHELYDNLVLPKRQTEKSAAYDISSCVEVVLKPLEMKLVPTGMKCQLNDNCFLAVYIRSSMAIKHGITLMNNVGIVDADYYNNKDNEGHFYVPLFNNNPYQEYRISVGDRIAQGIIQPYYITTDDNATGERIGGIGSTN